MKTLLTSVLVGLLSSSAAFATDGICTVHHSFKIPMLKSPSSRTITGTVENNAVVTLLDERGDNWVHIRKKNGGTTGWIYRGFLECPPLQMPEPLQGKWCHPIRVEGQSFFMNVQHRDYSSCDESGQPEIRVLSHEVQIDGSSCRPTQVTEFEVCQYVGHGFISRDDTRLGYHVKLRCAFSYETLAHDWIVGDKDDLELRPKRDRISCPR
jgi:hypothetical protein